MKCAIKFAHDISHSMNNIADIINAVIEKLLQDNFELPSFYRLNRIVRHTRHQVNNKIFHEVMHRLLANNHKTILDSLLITQNNDHHTLFNQLKILPKRPSIKLFNDFLSISIGLFPSVIYSLALKALLK
jgi:hypothetical protein